MTHLETNETIQKMIDEIHNFPSTEIKIKIFKTEKCPSAESFTTELSNLKNLFQNLSITEKYITPDSILHKGSITSTERLFETETQFAEFMCDSDIHVFLSHPHQVHINIV